MEMLTSPMARNHVFIPCLNSINNSHSLHLKSLTTGKKINASALSRFLRCASQICCFLQNNKQFISTELSFTSDMSTIWKTKRQVVRKNVSKRDVSKELAVILQDATNMLGLTGMGLSFIADHIVPCLRFVTKVTLTTYQCFSQRWTEITHYQDLCFPLCPQQLAEGTQSGELSSIPYSIIFCCKNRGRGQFFPGCYCLQAHLVLVCECFCSFLSHTLFSY